MLTKIILKEELNTEELQKLEILFKETQRDVLDSFLILTDSPQLARICRKMDMAVAAVLSGGENAVEDGEDTFGGEEAVIGGEDAFWGGEKAVAGGEDIFSDSEKDIVGGAEDFQGIPYAVTDTDDLDAEYLEKIWRRYRGIPWDICGTERCFIRETTKEDVESFYQIYSDKSITAYMENLYEDKEREEEYISEYIEKVYGFYGFGMWTVCLRETGEVIGRAGFSMREGFEEPELGYVIGKKWQRQGIAAEVCGEILNYGKDELGFERVRALMHPENAASKRLCCKLGFRYERELETDGEIYDVYTIKL